MASTHEEDTFVVEEFEISDDSDDDIFNHMSDDGENFSSEEDDEDATASDDSTWKMWSLPTGELIMSGEGHRDWVSDVAFSPTDPQLATTSGDSTVKLWDFKSASCVRGVPCRSMFMFSITSLKIGEYHSHLSQ